MRLSTLRMAFGLVLGALVGAGAFGVAPTAVFVAGALLAVALRVVQTRRQRAEGSGVGPDGRLVLSRDR